MRKATILVLVLLGGLVIVAWRAAPTAGGQARALATTGVGSVHGSYAFSETITDEEGGVNQPNPDLPGSPGTVQIRVAVGALTFDGNGHPTGVVSQNGRGRRSFFGYLQGTRVPIVGKYTLKADCTTTFDTRFHTTR